MKDLMPYKNQLMTLSYEEKIEISDWLHKQIDLERSQAIKEKAKQVDSQVNNFLDKAIEKTKNGGNSLLDAFRKMNDKTDNTQK
jgi:hypothetical protein